MTPGIYQRDDGTVFWLHEDNKWFYLSPLFGEWLEVFDQPNDGSLEKYPRNLEKVTGLLSVTEAQHLKVCRICLLNDTPSPGNPLVLSYGKEYAHQRCIELLKGRKQLK